MSVINGAIPVTGFIGPTDSNDTYAVTDAIFGIDGYRSVSAITARNSITLERRREGMLVYTQDDKNIWQLLEGPWTFTDSDWKLFISSAATQSLSGNTGFLSLSGGTVSGNTNFALNLTATTYYSGATPLQTILNNISVGSGSGFSGWTASSGVNSIIANNGTGNIASGDFSIAGGSSNIASGYNSLVVGGVRNIASGSSSFVGGGGQNYSYADLSFIGGGSLNIIYPSGISSFIGGGDGNKSYSSFSSILYRECQHWPENSLF